MRLNLWNHDLLNFRVFCIWSSLVQNSKEIFGIPRKNQHHLFLPSLALSLYIPASPEYMKIRKRLNMEKQTYLNWKMIINHDLRWFRITPCWPCAALKTVYIDGVKHVEILFFDLPTALSKEAIHTSGQTKSRRISPYPSTRPSGSLRSHEANWCPPGKLGPWAPPWDPWAPLRDPWGGPWGPDPYGIHTLGSHGSPPRIPMG